MTMHFCGGKNIFYPERISHFEVGVYFYLGKERERLEYSPRATLVKLTASENKIRSERMKTRVLGLSNK